MSGGNLDFFDFRESDLDEGRGIDWDSHLRVPDPFYAESLPCESCGYPVDSRKPAEWDSTLQVGPCCEVSLDIPELEEAPNCQSLWQSLSFCKTVGAVRLAMEAHRLHCAMCRGEKKGMESERPANRQERAA